MTKEINDLPATPGVASTDLLATKKGTADYRATVDQLSTIIRNDLTAFEVMQLIQQVDSDVSGLNANTLQGATRSFLQDADNLVFGKVSNNRLPNGEVTNYGGTAWSQRWLLPVFLLGQPVMIQFGVTERILESTLITVPFPTPFASGYGSPNEPFVMIAPMSDDGTGDTTKMVTSNIQLSMQMHKATLSNITMISQRLWGTGADRVRAFWLAIGKY